MNTIESNIILPILTFMVGLLIGLFYKYSDITGMKKDITHMKEEINVVNVTDLLAGIKTLKESIIFSPEFQRLLVTVCSEHERMRSKIDENTQDITTLKAQEDVRSK